MAPCPQMQPEAHGGGRVFFIFADLGGFPLQKMRSAESRVGCFRYRTRKPPSLPLRGCLHLAQDLSSIAQWSSLCQSRRQLFQDHAASPAKPGAGDWRRDAGVFCALPQAGHWETLGAPPSGTRRPPRGAFTQENHRPAEQQHWPASIPDRQPVGPHFYLPLTQQGTKQLC